MGRGGKESGGKATCEHGEPLNRRESLRGWRGDGDMYKGLSS